MASRWRVDGSAGVWLVRGDARAEASLLHGLRGEPMRPEAAAARVDAWFPGGWGDEGTETLASICRALTGSFPSEGMSDATWLKRTLRRALGDGRVTAVRAGLEAPVWGVEEEEPVTAPRPPVVEVPEEIFNPRWSTPRVEVGAELFAIVSHRDIKSPVDATIIVSELDRSAGRQEVGRIRTRIPRGSGDHRVKWRRTPDEAQADLREDEASGDTGPLEYRFTVESDPTCFGESGPLWLTNTVTVNLVKERDRTKHERARTVVLTDAIGDEHRARSKNGTATFEKVLVGPMDIRVATPRFTDLSWSEPKVPVGEAVDAIFHYDDAIAGMKVLVAIHETNADGSTTEIDCLPVELTGASGEARVSFTRTEDQARQDIRADELEGDAGPLEYRYRIGADGEESRASEPLWLTHTVSLKLDDTAEGKTFGDGLELVLVAADGTEHHAALARGSAQFEGVVCGPMTVKLAPRAKEARSAP